jgi:hypothetical protein
MLSSFSCPAIRLLHELLCGTSSFSQAALDEQRDGSCTVYHVWLLSLDMAEIVRFDKWTTSLGTDELRPKIVSRGPRFGRAAPKNSVVTFIAL